MAKKTERKTMTRAEADALADEAVKQDLGRVVEYKGSPPVAPDGEFSAVIEATGPVEEPTLDLRFDPPLDEALQEHAEALASEVALEMAGPLPPTPAGRLHAAVLAAAPESDDEETVALRISSALLRLRQLEGRCHTGGDVGLADIRQLIGILDPR